MRGVREMRGVRVLHRSESHQYISQGFAFIGNIGLAGQDHSCNLDAIVSFCNLLKVWLAEFWPNQLGLIALVDQIDIDDNLPAVVRIVFLTAVDLDLHLDFFGGYDAFSKSISHFII